MFTGRELESIRDSTKKDIEAEQCILIHKRNLIKVFRTKSPEYIQGYIEGHTGRSSEVKILNRIYLG